MAIAKDNTALCSEVVNDLKSSDGLPLNYLNGNKFTNSSGLPYWTNWNAAANTLFSNAKTSLNSSQKNSLFQSDSAARNTFPNHRLGKGTPKVYVPVDDSGNKLPVASFNDLSTMVYDAFFPFTNIRYSHFLLLKKVSGTNSYVRTNYYGNAFLTNAAILGQNGTNPLLNNANTKSRIILSNDSDYLLCGNIGSNVASLRPSVNPSNLYSGCLSAYVVSSMENMFLNADNRIRQYLSCEFLEVPITGPGSEVSVFYFEKQDGSGRKVIDKMPSYTTYQIRGYTSVFPNASDSGRFRGWSRTKNPNSPEANYAPGKTIYMQASNLSVYPCLRTPYYVKYHVGNAKNAARLRTTLSSLDNITVQFDEDKDDTMLRYQVYDGDTFTVKKPSKETLGKTEQKYVPFDQQKNTVTFSGYSTSRNSNTISYRNNNEITIKKNYNLYPVYAPVELGLYFKYGTHWHTQTPEGRYNAYTYPVTLNIHSETNGKGRYLNEFRKVSFQFVGWVNEFDHTHPCAVYVDIYAGTSTSDMKLIKEHRYIYGYGNNEWSYYRSEYATEAGYANWANTWTSEISLKGIPENSYKLFFYFYAEKGDNWGDGEGDVYVGWIKLV